MVSWLVAGALAVMLLMLSTWLAWRREDPPYRGHHRYGHPAWPIRAIGRARVNQTSCH